MEPTRGRLVVADDDADVRESLCELLERQGFLVVGRAADGAQAVILANETSPDVVVMDMRMPGVDGIAASKQIKGVLPNIQVIVLSAYDDESLHELADGAGVYCYLVKGCPPSLIGDMVLRACDFKRQMDGRAAPEPG